MVISPSVDNTIILIPARMGSTRFPGKPLVDIAGKPMIQHVVERALSANIGKVIVACAEQEIAEVISKLGVSAILTSPSHPSGTDRIFEALNLLGPSKESIEFIINAQGDLPLLEPSLLTQVLALLHQDPTLDMATLVTESTDPKEFTNPNIVKAILTSPHLNTGVRHALYFTRAAAPYGADNFWHHIGIYGFRKKALETFVSLPPSPLEMREKLEQLRALEHGMRIGVGITTSMPLGVDTPEDLVTIRHLINKRSHA